MNEKLDQAAVRYEGFNQVIKSLSKITGLGFEKTIKAEAGAILQNALKNTPKATRKKIIKYTLPQGYAYGFGTGGRIVTHRKGKVYHAGIPIEGAIGKRGGQKYLKPYTYWMNKRNKGGEWESFLQEQKEKAKRRAARRGMSAAQFALMGTILGIRLPKPIPKYIANPEHERVLKPHIMGSYARGERSKFQINLESKGLRLTKGSGANKKLSLAVQARVTFFRRAVEKGWIDDIKKFMPKNYPLLFQ